MACGDGYYTRLLKRAGASDATGVDVSAEMVRRAEELEKRDPLGCAYRQSEVAAFRPQEPVDVIVAVYSLGYSRTAEQLCRFCQACHDAPPPRGGGSWVSTTMFGFLLREPAHWRSTVC